MSRQAVKDVNSYIGSFPKSTQSLLRKLRAAIKKAAPRAEEKIGYGMPAYRQYGALVYFAGYERHIGFYPGAQAIVVFKKDIAKYKHAKGSIQFPLGEPLPLALVARIVRFRVKVCVQKAKEKEMKRKLKKMRA